MHRTRESLADVIESGRQLPRLSKALPADEELTKSLRRAGFTHRFGVPYERLTETRQPDAAKDIRIWPAPKKKKLR